MSQYDDVAKAELEDYTQMGNRYRELKQFVENLANGEYFQKSKETCYQDADDLLVKIGEWEGRE